MSTRRKPPKQHLAPSRKKQPVPAAEAAILEFTKEFERHHTAMELADAKKSRREIVTIIFLILTFAATLASNIIFYISMTDARRASVIAHSDNIESIKQAHHDSDASLSRAHMDSAEALVDARQSGLVQHNDTTAALGRATAANQINLETAKREMRAYLLVEPGELSPLVVGKPVRANIILTNTGRSPVRNETWESGFGVSRGNRIDERNFRWPSCEQLFSERTAHKQIIGRQVFIPKESEWHLEQIDIDKFNSGELTIFFAGRTCYKDIFNETHHVDMCFNWSNEGSNVSNQYCQTGNDAN